MRPSDYAVWAGATAAFPSAIYFWGTLICLLNRAALIQNAPQRWLTLQSRVCGPLCASVVCLVSLAASYSPTSGRAVSLRCLYQHGRTDTKCAAKSVSGGGQRTSARRRGTSLSLASSRAKESRYTESHLSHCGSRMLHTAIRPSRSLNSVSISPQLNTYHTHHSLHRKVFSRCKSSFSCGLRLLESINSSLTRFNFVNHPHHGTDPAKYGVKPTSEISETAEK